MQYKTELSIIDAPALGKITYCEGYISYVTVEKLHGFSIKQRRKYDATNIHGSTVCLFFEYGGNVFCAHGKEKLYIKKSTDDDNEIKFSVENLHDLQDIKFNTGKVVYVFTSRLIILNIDNETAKVYRTDAFTIVDAVLNNSVLTMLGQTIGENPESIIHTYMLHSAHCSGESKLVYEGEIKWTRIWKFGQIVYLLGYGSEIVLECSVSGNFVSKSKTSGLALTNNSFRCFSIKRKDLNSIVDMEIEEETGIATLVYDSSVFMFKLAITRDSEFAVPAAIGTFKSKMEITRAFTESETYNIIFVGLHGLRMVSSFKVIGKTHDIIPYWEQTKKTTKRLFDASIDNLSKKAIFDISKNLLFVISNGVYPEQDVAQTNYVFDLLRNGKFIEHSLALFCSDPNLVKKVDRLLETPIFPSYYVLLVLCGKYVVSIVIAAKTNRYIEIDLNPLSSTFICCDDMFYNYSLKSIAENMPSQSGNVTNVRFCNVPDDVLRTIPSNKIDGKTVTVKHGDTFVISYCRNRLPLSLLPEPGTSDRTDESVTPHIENLRQCFINFGFELRPLATQELTGFPARGKNTIRHFLTMINNVLESFYDTNNFADFMDMFLLESRVEVLGVDHYYEYLRQFYDGSQSQLADIYNTFKEKLTTYLKIQHEKALETAYYSPFGTSMYIPPPTIRDFVMSLYEQNTCVTEVFLALLQSYLRCKFVLFEHFDGNTKISPWVNQQMTQDLWFSGKFHVATGIVENDSTEEEEELPVINIYKIPCAEETYGIITHRYNHVAAFEKDCFGIALEGYTNSILHKRAKIF